MSGLNRPGPGVLGTGLIQPVRIGAEAAQAGRPGAGTHRTKASSPTAPKAAPKGHAAPPTGSARPLNTTAGVRPGTSSIPRPGKSSSSAKASSAKAAPATGLQPGVGRPPSLGSLAAEQQRAEQQMAEDAEQGRAQAEAAALQAEADRMTAVRQAARDRERVVEQQSAAAPIAAPATVPQQTVAAAPAIDPAVCKALEADKAEALRQAEVAQVALKAAEDAQQAAEAAQKAAEDRAAEADKARLAAERALEAERARATADRAATDRTGIEQRVAAAEQRLADQKAIAEQRAAAEQAAAEAAERHAAAEKAEKAAAEAKAALVADKEAVLSERRRLEAEKQDVARKQAEMAAVDQKAAAVAAERQAVGKSSNGATPAAAAAAGGVPALKSNAKNKLLEQLDQKERGVRPSSDVSGVSADHVAEKAAMAEALAAKRSKKSDSKAKGDPAEPRSRPPPEHELQPDFKAQREAVSQALSSIRSSILDKGRKAKDSFMDKVEKAQERMQKEIKAIPEKPPQVSAEARQVLASLDSKLPKCPRICILGSKSFTEEDSEAITAALGRKMAEMLKKFNEEVIVVTGGMDGVQKAFAQAFGRTDRLYNLLPAGQKSDYGVGTDLPAGRTDVVYKEVMGSVGNIYVIIEGGPGVAFEAQIAALRGPAVGFVPMKRTGGACAGLYLFPQERLRKPSPSVTFEQWASVCDEDAPVEESAAAAVEIVELLLREKQSLVPVVQEVKVAVRRICGNVCPCR